MACLPNTRLQDYYKKFLNKPFFDSFMFCVPCEFHFTVNCLDPNGLGVTCPRCHSNDQNSLIEIGTVKVELVEIWNENIVFTDFQEKDGSIFLDYLYSVNSEDDLIEPQLSVIKEVL
jgi:hypothetical protein